MTSYYADNLSGSRLQRCYDVASPRVKRYLEAEIEHVQSLLQVLAGGLRIPVCLFDQTAHDPSC